ncbi:MAG: hypothetical protein KC636_22400 [Myxococcales bacterium]|nr:hypothetical protein [Myxococcales bacterium]
MAEDRAHVVKHAAQLLRHPHRGRLIEILAARLVDDDYPDARERRLDAITLAIARAIDEQLEEPTT